MIKYILPVLLFFIILQIIPQGNNMINSTPVFSDYNSLDADEKKQLSEKKYFFGHQSVGFNILDGISDIMQADNVIQIKIKETIGLQEYDNPVLGHYGVGENRNPELKLKDFARFLNSGIGEKIDVAFLKLCFVDVHAETDINKLFSDYKQTMAVLQNSFPELKLVHFTVPLTKPRDGFKRFVKRKLNAILGKPVEGFDDNIKRNQFNDLLRNEYVKDNSLFDIAYYESTYPDGKKNQLKKGSIMIDTLIPAYGSDHGHLNEKGRKIIAEQLLVFLANIK